MNQLTLVHPRIAEAKANFHADTVAEVARTVATNTVVVVGMAQNPVVKNARKFLTAKGVKFEYLEYGSYLSKWKLRLAIKIWSGWPTFPQVYANGMLIGGYADLVALEKAGELDDLLKARSPA